MEAKGKGIKKKGHHLAKGRIRYFDRAGYTPETLDLKIEEYFNDGEPLKDFTYFTNGKPTTKQLRLFTFPGLCLFLGFDSREGYKKAMNDTKNPFSSCLKKGYIMLQKHLEELTQTAPNPAGAVFILKNMDYSDSQTVSQTVTEVKPPEIITQDKETNKEINKLFKLNKTA